MGHGATRAIYMLCVLVFALSARRPLPAYAAGERVQATTWQYTCAIEGVEGDLRDILVASSWLVSLQATPPASFAGLRHRVAGDIDRFRIALRSEGYYAAQIEDVITREPAVSVTIRVVPGERFRMGTVAVDLVGEVGEGTPQIDPQTLGFGANEPARAPDIVRAERKVLRHYEEHSHPYVRINHRRVIVDHDTKRVDVIWSVAPGAHVRFGEVMYVGLETVREDYLRRLIPWEQGETFARSKLRAYQRALDETALFEAASVDFADAPTADGAVAITVTVAEAKPRTVGIGFNYSSSEGAGGEVFWEHRNLRGSQERLRIEGTFSQLEQGVFTEWRTPHFRRLDQDLIVGLEIANRETDPFDEETISLSVGVERQLHPWWSAAAGVEVEVSRVTDIAGARTFLLVGWPLALDRDTTDDPLDPTEGTRLHLELTPYVGGIDQSLFFLVQEATATAFHALDDDARFVVAGRVRLGSIVGATNTDLPASKRLYSGGGGSVRGFDFQAVGPLDVNGDPTGGRSALEVGAELRTRVTERIGLVPFVEGGAVSTNPYPTFDTPMLWAAGLGVRYFTAIGPIRFDVAVPLNGRPTDDAFEFYISIGQAF